MEGCYPKFLYHASKEPVIVKDRAEHEAMGPEWAESPGEAAALADKAVKAPEDEAAPAPKPAKGSRRAKA